MIIATINWKEAPYGEDAVQVVRGLQDVQHSGSAVLLDGASFKILVPLDSVINIVLTEGEAE